MIAFIRDNNVYIRIPKNGITTFISFLKKNGYQEINLFDCGLDISKLNIWGHITDPEVRHTKGVAEFLERNPEVNYQDPIIGKMLVTGMFDVHTYTIHMMLGPLIKYPINWIPLDANITKWNRYPTPPELLNGDDLTNIYFDDYGLGMKITESDHKNKGSKFNFELRDYITELKKHYNKEYQFLFKNVLEPDVMLYHNVLKKYNDRFI
jgi:hypothetical protein